MYMGKRTHAGKLLEFLEEWDGVEALTPEQIRMETDLTLSKFKEAKKHHTVRQYFSKYIETSGSGKHTVYRKRPA